jgi:tetratricopeptide (TPR) repeat protein
MTALARRCAIAFLVLAFPAVLVPSSTASAQEPETPTREAGKHFQRGVVLYSEADYRAALVEFRRAYGLAPNAAVLYNIGETEYQLQDYAAALTTFRRYLAEAGPTESHRAEVESNVEVLRMRVGHVTVSTVPPGAEVTIDEQTVGRTPLDEPVLVSIGHRRVGASIPGRPPVDRYIDVATDDNLSVTLSLPSSPSDTTQVSGRPQQPAPAGSAASSSTSAGPTLRVVGWVTTGALAVGAGTFAVLANKATSDLKNARNTFPTTSATLTHDANLTTTYSVIADSLTAAAIVVGGITLYSTLSSHSSNASKSGRLGGARVMIAPASARFEMTF